MERRLLLYTLLCAMAAILVVGCGPTCESRCEEGRGCPRADPVADCNAACAEVNAFLAASGCQETSEKYQTCIDEQDPVCRQSVICDPELEAYRACRMAYCSDSPMADGCPG